MEPARCWIAAGVVLIGALALTSAPMDAGALAAERPPPAVAKRLPNYILIVADDLGWADISLRGTAPVQTPNIDRIAREGVDFRQAYAANAVCAPSRAALLTGRDQHRFGFEFNPAVARYSEVLANGDYGPLSARFFPERVAKMPPADQIGLPLEESTLAERLKSRGYVTGFFGKWHLGSERNLRPDRQGFDRSVGVMSGASLFAPAGDPSVVEARLSWSPVDNSLWRILRYRVFREGEETFDDRKYQTDLWADETVTFIDQAGDRPFFAYVAFNAPHAPLQAPRSVYDELSGIPDHKTRVYYAMVLAMDRAIGRVLAAVDARGLADNTVIIFTSDNGGAHYTGIGTHNQPYRGFKATFWDGGVHVPLLVRWPGRIPAGTVSDRTVSLLDVTPTLTRAAGGRAASGKPFDGMDLFQTLGRRGKDDRVLFWRADPYRAVRAGSWKMIRSERPDKVWLYDLASDPFERLNLADRRPDVVARLDARLVRHFSAMPLARWPALVEAPVFADPVPPECESTAACLDPATHDYVQWPE